MVNLLQNPSFENGWHQTSPNSGNQTPDAWELTWLDLGAPLLSSGAFPGEDAPIIDVAQFVPECVHKMAWQLPQDEWLGAPDALILDGTTTYKIFGVAFGATLAQTVTATPGAVVTLRVPVQVHHHGDGSYGACAVRARLGDAATAWATFGDGLPDPDDPEWVTLELTATVPASGAITAALDCEGRALAPVDFFIDAVSLEAIEPPTPPEPQRGAPRVQYARSYWLLPYDATLDDFDILADLIYDSRGTIGFSADDAGIGDLDVRRAIVVWTEPDSWSVDEIEGFFAAHYPGVEVQHLFLYDTPEPPDDWTPINYTPVGTKLGFHCVGGYPLDRVQTLAQAGVVLPTVKLVESIGDLSVAVERYRIGRIIDWAGFGNLEGFNYNGNPEAQAEARMATLMPLFAPYKARLSFIEITNEQDCASPSEAVKLARFYIRAMQIAEANGYHLALFSLPLGCPEQDEWEAMADTGVFELAAAGGHAISLHEYDTALGGPNSIICRYRGLYENIILPLRLNIPLFITEYNVDEGRLGGDLLAEWAAYDALVSADPYVAGVHIYSLGMAGKSAYPPRVVATLARFVDYSIAQRARVNG